MKYAVTITETLERTVFVDAESWEQADSAAREMYREAEIILSADDFVEAEFKTEEANGPWDDAQLAIAVSNWAVRTASANTTNGNWLVYDEEIMTKFGLTEPQVMGLKDAVLAELLSREEILEASWHGDCLDLTAALAFCPNYEWEAGDEEVFDCTYEEWLERDALPVIDRPIL